MNKKTARKLNKYLFFFWIVIGLPVSVLLGNIVYYVTALSVYTIIMEHYVAGWATE